MTDEINSTEELKPDAPVANAPETEPAPAPEPLQVDHEIELKRERERADKAQKKAAELAFKLREKSQKKESEDDFLEEDKPITAKELDEKLANDRYLARTELRKELEAENFITRVRRLATSETEEKLMVEIYKNRSFPEDMSLDEKAEEVYAIANRKKILAENAELKRSLAARAGRSTDGATTYRDSLPADEPKNSADNQALINAGFQWDGKLRLYISKLAGGRTLTYDPKTKKRTLV